MRTRQGDVHAIIGGSAMCHADSLGKPHDEDWDGRQGSDPVHQANSTALLWNEGRGRGGWKMLSIEARLTPFLHFTTTGLADEGGS